MDALIVDVVTKSFGSSPAVDALSFSVPPGVIYGFLGPNGAGKTTTIRMVMDIIRPDNGRIAIFGAEPSSSARARVGYMPEERGLYRKMTARKMAGYMGRLHGLDARTADQAASRWLDRVGLAPHASQKVEELSKGMQQKLQFICTVVHDPDLLILDEPFSGLDPINLELIKNILLDMRAAGKTILYSTHMMEHAERLCDLLLLLNKGRKVFEGPLDALQTGGDGRTIVLQAEGPLDFLASLPWVESASYDNSTVIVTLREPGQDQQLLQTLAGQTRITKFEIKKPSLHELFVQQIGDDHAQDPSSGSA